jgi:hypothetical protein
MKKSEILEKNLQTDQANKTNDQNNDNKQVNDPTLAQTDQPVQTEKKVLNINEILVVIENDFNQKVSENLKTNEIAINQANEKIKKFGELIVSMPEMKEIFEKNISDQNEIIKNLLGNPPDKKVMVFKHENFIENMVNELKTKQADQIYLDFCEYLQKKRNNKTGDSSTSQSKSDPIVGILKIGDQSLDFSSKKFTLVYSEFLVKNPAIFNKLHAKYPTRYIKDGEKIKFVNIGTRNMIAQLDQILPEKTNKTGLKNW